MNGFINIYFDERKTNQMVTDIAFMTINIMYKSLNLKKKVSGRS